MAATTCHNCGLPVTPQDAFCRGCGTSFLPPQTAPGYYQSQPGAGYPNQQGYGPNQPDRDYQLGGQYPNPPGRYSNERGGYFPNQPGGYPRQAAMSDDIPIVAPYAAPPAEPGTSYSSDPRHWVWRQGKTLVFHERAELPDRCIKCNEPARGCRLKKRLAWHHPAWALLVLVGIVIYLIVAAVVRKRATVNLGFCTRHLRQRRACMASGWLLLVGGLAVLHLALILQSGPSAFAGLGLLVVSAVAGIITKKFIGLKKIENQRVWLKNVDERFLARFPPLG